MSVDLLGLLICPVGELKAELSIFNFYRSNIFKSLILTSHSFAQASFRTLSWRVGYRHLSSLIYHLALYRSTMRSMHKHCHLAPATLAPGESSTSCGLQLILLVKPLTTLCLFYLQMVFNFIPILVSTSCSRSYCLEDIVST